MTKPLSLNAYSLWMAVVIGAVVASAQTLGGSSVPVPSQHLPGSDPSTAFSFGVALIVGGAVVLLGRLRKGRR